MDQETREAFAKIDRYFELVMVRFDGLEQRIDGLEQRIDRLEQRIDRLEQRIDRLEQRMDGLEGELTSLRIEMRERFESVDQQLRTQATRLALFEAQTDLRFKGIEGRLSTIEVQMAGQQPLLAAIGDRLHELGTRVDVLTDDMRQRFRVVNERLAKVA